MKAVIVEDEPLVARDLVKLLGQLAPDLEIIAKLTSVEEACAWFSSHPEPELVFMDIQLSDGVSFSIFDHVKIEVPVIFTTAYNEYAIRAFKVNSIDYLLKPIDKLDLTKSLEKFRRLKSLQQNSLNTEQIGQLIKSLQVPVTESPRYKERFMVQYRNAMVPVAGNKVSHFVKDELIYLVSADDQQRYICEYETMDELESLLDPKYFFRANRQYIIRLEAVESFKSGFNGKLILKIKGNNALEIDISREKAALFKTWLD